MKHTRDATPHARETWRCLGGTDRAVIVDDTDQTVASVPRREGETINDADARAHQIVRDHNAVGAMREALQAVVEAETRRAQSSCYAHYYAKAMKLVSAALAQAGRE